MSTFSTKRTLNFDEPKRVTLSFKTDLAKDRIYDNSTFHHCSIPCLPRLDGGLVRGERKLDKKSNVFFLA